ncbi:hypothetical protein [Bradyrhizobium icense]|uniref:Uncharacterized protein n=1 Tax=Bradyrhizobium icense TaxID=1274631 RepID=A0A1B1UD47_9BRAD|nr:hypothetical protein [Bradyrhizobium icense]ANW00702.1 hypothetical protein LMTR13_11490 [Bradyrhizobium icense]
MSEMIERVARAIAVAIVSQSRSGATFDEKPVLMIADEDSNSFWELMPVARAAIEAMRKPTQAMVDQFEGHKEQEAAAFYWGWMIDAALKDG